MDSSNTEQRTVIRKLAAEVVNQIAAGEVVERPASVVKELVENAIDAGAGRIECRVENGGRDLIEVSDDGHGMTADDLKLAVEQHATSKIASAADLAAVATLGFRGEALSSIASVSRLRLVSRVRSQTHGHWMEFQAGRLTGSGEVGAPVGTTVRVSDLFFNTPARRKFLRTVATELGHVQSWLQRLALARPPVHLVLYHGRRRLLDLPPCQDLAQRVASVVGRQVFEHLYPVAGKAPGMTVSGLLSDPYETRANSRDIHFVVNGRYVRDRFLQQAVVQAARSVLPAGRLPVAVLVLSLQAELLDVNVHPQKVEVRFASPQAVRGLVQAALARVWAAAPWLPGTRSYRLQPDAAGAREPAGSRPHTAGGGASPGGLPAVPRRQLMANFAPATVGAGDADPPGALETAGTETAWQPLPLEQWHLAGRLWRTYLLLTDQQRLVVVDQHAAAERITFEKLRRQARDGAIAAQRLLVRENVEIEARLHAVWQNNRDELERLGFELEDFGERVVQLRAVPALLAGSEAAALLRDTLDEIASSDGAESLPARRDEVLGRMACHASVRAGQDLSEPEIRELLRQLQKVDHSGTCPHGRPVLVELTREDVARWFGRS